MTIDFDIFFQKYFSVKLRVHLCGVDTDTDTDTVWNKHPYPYPYVPVSLSHTSGPVA